MRWKETPTMHLDGYIRGIGATFNAVLDRLMIKKCFDDIF